jgi:hypothetical protein
VTAVKVRVPVTGAEVSLSRKKSKVAVSPSAVHMARCLATGRMGRSVPAMGAGSDLKLRRLSTMPEWFSMAVDSQPEMAQKSRSSEMRAFSR